MAKNEHAENRGANLKGVGHDNPMGKQSFRRSGCGGGEGEGQTNLSRRKNADGPTLKKIRRA